MDITDTIQETTMTPHRRKNEKLYCFEELDVLSGELTDCKSSMEVEKERKSIFVRSNL
jgi:hypothetical protein